MEIESTLLWAEENLRKPRSNWLEGYGVGHKAPDSPTNKRWMRVFTTMGLTHSDGYVLYTIRTSDHSHIWYNFWDADLGRPIGPKGQPYQNREGLFIREFTNGWAVYNRSGEAQDISFSAHTTGVNSGNTGTTHQLPDLDGEIYLKAKNPADVNGDGKTNILDLVMVSRQF
jgi:hypothetical protein